MAEVKTNPLVCVQDNAGNRYLCPLDQLRDANSVFRKLENSSRTAP